ncbi:TonB-dependent siderophore receptor [Psychrobacter sp. I-STPA10]|uniref:TonB-dependent siderophore receptor n=1 Tax=Psychrobacter sp. I-STPA10 TaxID=2585769 RepID=UPI001E45A5A3|nr:TonB-dependent siderophore receptor [Psychrobacter sp. I-STPA10]
MYASAMGAVATSSQVYAQTPDQDFLPSTTVPPIIVTADPESADGPVYGIAASTVSSTTGTDESILKSTQSVTVVGQQEMQSVGANDVVEALEYSAGVNRTEAEDRTTESYVVRGFPNFFSYRDGQRFQNNTYDGQQEVYGLDRIELIRGPASVLSGTLPPGGVINAISKKPFFNNAYEVNAEVGNFNHKQVSTDINQVINDDLAVRLVGVYRDSDTFVDFVPDDRTYIAPSLTWQPNDTTKLTLKADYQHDLTDYVEGIPAEGSIYSTDKGKVARSFNQAVKGFNKYDNTRYTLGYDIEQQVNPDLLVKHSLQYMDADIEFPSGYIYELISGSDSEYTRASQKRFDKSSTLIGNVAAVYNWNATDNINNVSLFGIDYSKLKHSTERYEGTASNIDLYNPNHSLDSVGEDFTPIDWSSTDHAKQMGIYLQNQMTFNDQWVGVVGVRHDKVTLEETPFFDPSDPSQHQEGDYSATTGRAGVAYLMDNGIAPYASVNQSFEVNLGKDRQGNLFKPTKGTQYEVGVRYQPEGSDTLLTGSVYRIDKTNVGVEDPVDDDFQVQLGKVRSQGIELEAKTAINDNTNLIAAYAYTDARTIESSPATPELEGKRSGNVPYNSFSIWSDYRFADFGMPQLKVGAGVRYRGSAIGIYDDNEFAGYTLVDAMASYQINDNWSLSLNARNLLDKEYVTCTYNCFYGEPRNIVGKVTYKW